MKITKTSSGKWTTLVAISGIDGKRHYKRFTGKTKDQVRNDANEYLNRNKVYIESQVLSDCMTRYLDSRTEILSPNTIRGYKCCSRVLMREYGRLCSKSVDRITSADLQAAVDDMVRKGKSPHTIKNRIGFLSAVFSAENMQLPTVSLPAGRQPDIHVPGEHIIKCVMEEARGTRMEVPIGLAAFGLRCGEICAVEASDIDERNMLHVCKAIATDDDGFTYVKTPKSKAGDRYLIIPQELADLVRKQGRAWKGTPKALSDAFPHLLNRAGITGKDRFRLHDCRHFFVSYCHELGLSDAQIIELSGHKTDYIMKTFYRHAITDQRERVAGQLGNLLQIGH